MQKSINYFFLALTLSLLNLLNAQAQCPLDSLIVLRTQAEIDSLPIKYSNCKKFKNIDIINDWLNPGPIASDLSPFLGIDSIEGNFRINVQNLKNLHGLDSLLYIGGSLIVDSDIIYGGHHFESFHGLEKLKSIHGDFNVLSHLPKLKNFLGLNALEEVGGTILIDTDDIETMDGFDKLSKLKNGQLSVYSNKLKSLRGLGRLDSTIIQIHFNFHLKNFEGLENFQHGSIYIINSDSLSSLKGLEKWNSGGSLTIFACPRLSNLSGIENLKHLEGQINIEDLEIWRFGLWLEYNETLADISVLDHAVSIENGIYIANNKSLSSCSVKSICDFLVKPSVQYDTLVIRNNKLNCNSAAEVLSLCTSHITEIDKTKEVAVFPNPIFGSQNLNIHINNGPNEPIIIEIYGLDGSLKSRSEKIITNETKQITLPSWDLPNVSYLRIFSDSFSSTVKVFKI